ncbi:MAG: hypothetical protein ABFS05_09665, partial [Bacteroidota bacterium]
DAWTQANNGGPYFSVGGLDRTGIIYEPLVAFGSYGGYVTGGSTISLGQNTGTLTLEEYQGSILKWQKRVDAGAWTDIANTAATYSEIPSSIGTWEYRAVVQEGTCPQAYSDPAIVIVLPPASVWTGNTDTDWFKATNWTQGVPVATQDATIPAAPLNQPHVSNVSEIANCDDLSIESGAVVTVATDGDLSVYGILSNATGNSGMIIKSDAGGTGSLIHNTAAVNATVERYINNWTAGNEDLGWHFLSSPVATQPIRPEFIPLGNPLPVEIDFYKWDEDHVAPGCIGCWINTKDDVGNWNTSFEDNMVVGRGYLMAYTAPYGNMAKEFSGQINVNDLTVTNQTYTTNSSHPGWHLMGNPFSSALDWTLGSWVKDNIGAIPQIWDEDAASYELIDNLGGDNSIIPAHNGFMVYTDVNNNNTLTIPADARVHDDHIWYKSYENETIRLLAHDLDKGLRQQTSIRENMASSIGFDLQYDSYFMAGYAPMFYSVSNDEAFALNTLPEIISSSIIPLSFITNGSLDFSIELETAPEELDIYLHDLKLDIISNLKTDPVYEFTSLSGDDPERFLLRFAPVGIEENKHSDDVSAWYNNEQLHVDLKTDECHKLMVFNSMGQLIHEEAISGQGLHTYAFKLPAGLYVGRILSNNGSATIKFYTGK